MFDFLFPRMCPMCGTYTRDYACTSCVLSSVAIHEGFLGTTRIPLFSCARYSNPGVRTAVHAAKFSGEQTLFRRIGELISDIPDIRTFLLGSILVPIPLHPLRRVERGYNQSEEFIHGLCMRNAYQYAKLLKRSGSTRAQSQLKSTEKAQNAIQFLCTPMLPKTAQITLVDDVVTSGTTLLRAAEALQRAGYTHIQCFTFASG